MNDVNVAAPLQAALAARGYETLTAVQQAVLVPEAAGRDLLVSAQTGSGKTVAFGLAIAPQVLGDGDIAALPETPLALVVAPTRELALQVQREFEWLYEGAVVASCVGGMDYRNERRALSRGAHIVVGTPGRLRDHVERGSLVLTGLRAAVLDEADEMLDLGFAEDLEFLLGAGPEDKRVLMFSATVPKDIEALARTYQKNALRVVAQGEATQHADIAYQAISVAARDKEPAIFNLLRYHEARCAIVFAKTRANVNHLFARMLNRGFPVVALSGELSQSERLHALQALRDGRARVCIATDVAARGIDLPGLDLVIHADLPSNPDVLLHRSGRTGRAGRKGLSVVVAAASEAKKAARLLQGAKVTPEWVKPPTAEDVQAREDQRLMDDPALTEGPGDEAGFAADLLAQHGAEAVAAAFVRQWRKGRAAPEVLSDEPMTPPMAPQPPKPRGEFGPAVWFRLSVGHSGRAEARWLLPKICDAGGIAKDSIGAIRVQQEETFVQIAEGVAARFPEAADIEPGLTMTRLAAEPDLSRPAPRFGTKPEGRAPKAPYQPKPARVVEDAEGEARDAARKVWPKRAAEAAAPRPFRDAEAPRKPFAPRDADAPRKPYAPRDADAPRKPYTPRDAEAPRKPYTSRDAEAPRKPYAPRDADAPRKPYAPRDADAPRKPYTPRAAAAEGDAVKKPRWTPTDRADRGDKPAPRSAGFKSHGAKDGTGRATGYKSHGDRPARAEGDAPRADRKPWAPKGDEARPYARRSDDAGAKPAGKSWGAKTAGDRPARAPGDKPYKPAGDKPYKPAGDKPFRAAGDKPYGKPARPPAAPRASASDTSKRFTPPKKPRG